MPKLPPTSNPQIEAWRKRNKRFRFLKKLLLALLQKYGFNREQTLAWLNTPLPELNGRTPKALLNPICIEVLLRHARKSLAAFNKV